MADPLCLCLGLRFFPDERDQKITSAWRQHHRIKCSIAVVMNLSCMIGK
jgi:hypothetical protein